MPSSQLERGSEHLRWTIKPELLVSPLTGAEISMGIAYGPVLGVETVVCPVEEMVLARGARDEKRERAESQLAVIQEAATRLIPLVHRAITEAGASGDAARQDLHEAVDWMARGCPVSDVPASGPDRWWPSLTTGGS